MIMECHECHNLVDCAELTIEPGGQYKCPGCSGPYLLIRIDLQRSPEGRIIPCPGNLGGPGGFPALIEIPETDRINQPEK